MSIQHEDITDPKIHEPKGASTASVNTVYVANGIGSGTWQKIASSQINITDLESTIQDDLDDGTIDVTGNFFISGVITDVSTASSVLIPIIRSCTIVGASFVLGGAITTANATVQVKNSSGATMGANVTIVQSGSAKGNQYAFTATGNNVLTGPTWLEVATDGASDTAVPLYFTIQMKYTAN